MIRGSCALWLLSAPFPDVKFHLVQGVKNLLIFVVAMKAKLLSLACPKWTLRSGLVFRVRLGKQRELKAAEDGKAAGRSREAVGWQMLFSPAPAFAFYHQKH